MPDYTDWQDHVMIAEETQRRGRLVLHALPILLIPLFTAAVAYLLLRWTNEPLPAPRVGVYTDPMIMIIVIAVFLTALIVLVRVGRPTISALLLIGVWTLLTTLTTLRGGIAGMGPAMLIIPILAAGLLIDGLASLSLASLATVLVGSIAWLEMRGVYVAPTPWLPEISPFPSLAVPIFLAAAWTGLYWTVALLTSLLAGGLQRALQQSRDQERALRELSDQLEARVTAQTAELNQRATRAEALYEVSRALASTLDLNRILALITEQAAHLLDFDSAYVLLRQPDGSFRSLWAFPDGAGSPGSNGAGLPVRSVLDATAGVDPDVPARLREVIETHSARLLPAPSACGEDAAGSPAGGGLSRELAPGPSALVLPMRYGDSVAGVLMLTSPDSHALCDGDDLVLGQGLADQAAVAIANARFLEEARAAATMEERTRLARDIHDTLAQGLTGVVVQLGATQRALDLAPTEAREHLGVALRMARESLAEARRSVWNLRAPALQREGLHNALRALTVRPLGSRVAVSFEQLGEAWDVPSQIESTLLRVTQEALTNVARHAQATEASITLEYRPDRVCLRIRDNGVGINPQVLDDATLAPGPWGGFGLVGMHERVSALGGTLRISGEDGVEILAEIPRPDGAAHSVQATPAAHSVRTPMAAGDEEAAT